jgi:hypothetical protein
MEVKIFDIHITTADQKQYHFDVVVENATSAEAREFALEYLASIDVEISKIRQESCQFCHQKRATKEMIKSIKQNGYYIIALEGCPK